VLKSDHAVPYVIEVLGIGLAQPGVLVGCLFWRKRAALSSTAALHAGPGLAGQRAACVLAPNAQLSPTGESP
jgi:hypothetical protein